MRPPHPSLRRLCASGATAGRLHAAMERGEHELGRVAFDIGRLRLLDDRVLAPLTGALCVGDALARDRSGPFEPNPTVRMDNEERKDAPIGVIREEKSSSAHTRDGDHRIREAARDFRELPEHTSRQESRVPLSAPTLPSARRAPFINVDDAALCDAQAAVARRLEVGLPSSAAKPASGRRRSRHDLLRAMSPRLRRSVEAGDAFVRDMAPSGVKPAPLAASTTTPLRIGIASHAVSEILERVASDERTSLLARTSARNRSSTDVLSPADSHHGLATVLETAAARASNRGSRRRATDAKAPLRTGVDQRKTRAASINPEDHAGGGSGLRRLIARAGVTPLSAAGPPHAGVERAEGTTGVVADRVEESALAQRLGRLLRREARRAGIDLDEADA